MSTPHNLWCCLALLTSDIAAVEDAQIEEIRPSFIAEFVGFPVEVPDDDAWLPGLLHYCFSSHTDGNVFGPGFGSGVAVAI